MTNVQQGSRWQVPLAIIRCLEANLATYADRESDRLAAEVGELTGDDYAGSGVMLRIPDVVSIAMKMDSNGHVVATECPAIYVSGRGQTTFSSAISTVQQMFASTPVEIAAYVTTRAVYQGGVYRLTESELIYLAGALGGAIVSTLGAIGVGSIWAQGIGMNQAVISGLNIAGHATADGKTSAAKITLSIQMDHDQRYA